MRVMLLLTAISATATAAGLAQEKNAPAKPNRPDLLRASKEAGTAYDTLLVGKDHEGLRRLCADADTGVALQAAWRDFGKENPQRFIGFLEGRAWIRVPRQWELSLVDHVLRNDPDLHRAAAKHYARFVDAGKRGKEGQELQYHRTPIGVDVQTGTVVERKDNKVLLRVGESSVRFHESVISDARKRYISQSRTEILAAHLGTGHAYIALHGSWGQSHPLICLDSNSGEVLWRATAWATGTDNLSGLSGGSRYDLEVVVDHDRVGVFGHTLWTFSAEAFDSATGNPLFRFSTNNWHVRQK